MNNHSEENFNLSMDQKDTIGLYLSLKNSRDQLNDSSARIVKKIEEYLYTILTIEEFAHIDEYYTNISL
jgi:hypothetical protein